MFFALYKLYWQPVGLQVSYTFFKSFVSVRDLDTVTVTLERKLFGRPGFRGFKTSMGNRL